MIHIRLNYDYWTLPEDSKDATGTTFWKVVDDAVLSLFPGSEVIHYYMGHDEEPCGETWIRLGPPVTITYKDTLLGVDTLEQQCELVKNTLETRAEQR